MTILSRFLSDATECSFVLHRGEGSDSPEGTSSLVLSRIGISIVQL